MISKFIKIVLFVMVSLFSTSVYALNVETHEAINKRIANGAVNGFSLDSYLKGNVGLKGGVEEIFNGKMIYKWISLGGIYEDDHTAYLFEKRVRPKLKFFWPAFLSRKAGCNGLPLCVITALWKS